MKRLFTVLAVLAAAASFADEAAAPAAAPAASEPAKRKPRKEKEYRDWDKAAAVAEAWEQPVLAFIETAGDKEAAKLRLATIERQGIDFNKEFVKPNCVFFHFRIPAVKEKRPNNGNNNQRRVKTPPKPDFSALKAEDRAVINRLLAKGGGNGGQPNLPAIVLADASGTVIDGSLGGSAPETFYGWVGDLKSAMEGRKYAVEISSKLQKAMDAEKKKKEKEKKQ